MERSDDRTWVGSGGSMRKVAKKVFFPPLCIVALAGAAAMGQQVVTFGITSAGPNNLAGVYTDPYNGVVCQSGQPNCNSVQNTPLLAFCDDFFDDVNPPQYWQAFSTDLALLPGEPSTTVYYSTGGTFNGQTFTETQGYVAAAILAIDSLQARQINDVNTENVLSFALWSIFDANITVPCGTGVP